MKSPIHIPGGRRAERELHRAAQELGVTRAAISQLVKQLEASLGVSLFARAHQRLSLTEAGRDYLAVVPEALDRIALGTDRLVAGGRSFGGRGRCSSV
jgi:LysR family glycine cleavage system transcriptional activator